MLTHQLGHCFQKFFLSNVVRVLSEALVNGLGAGPMGSCYSKLSFFAALSMSIHLLMRLEAFTESMTFMGYHSWVSRSSCKA